MSCNTSIPIEACHTTSHSSTNHDSSSTSNRSESDQLPSDTDSPSRTESAQPPSIPRRFSVYPTSLLRASVLHRSKFLPISQTHLDLKMRLAAEDLRMERLKSLRSSTRERIAAEETWTDLQRAELAAEGSSTFSNLDTETALKLARTTRNALKAEAAMTALQIEEHEEKLKVLKDSLDDIHARTEDANYQLGSILNSVRQENIQVDMQTLKAPTPKITHPHGLEALDRASVEDFSDLDSEYCEDVSDAESEDEDCSESDF